MVITETMSALALFVELFVVCVPGTVAVLGVDDGILDITQPPFSVDFTGMYSSRVGRGRDCCCAIRED